MLFERNDIATTRGGWSQSFNEEEIFTSIEDHSDDDMLDDTSTRNPSGHLDTDPGTDADMEDVMQVKHTTRPLCTASSTFAVSTGTVIDHYGLPILPPSIFDDVSTQDESHPAKVF